MFLAAGLNPNKSIIFIQSDNPDHTNLAWILSSLVTESELKRMTQYKDKMKKQASVAAGLLSYPILQAADILLYDTQTVPVGEDQIQHIEFARKLARSFNNKFDDIFIEPEAKVVKEAARIMSLTDPKSKMSKSGSDKSKINLSDSPKDAASKIMSAVTDSGKEIKFDFKRKPAISNLLSIYHLVSGESIQKLEKRYSDKGYGQFKKDLAKSVSTLLGDLQEKRKSIVATKKTEEVLSRGLKDARDISNKKLEEAKRSIGLA
jgi:tryptophanyl-tRNA synthetase